MKVMQELGERKRKEERSEKWNEKSFEELMLIKENERKIRYI